MNDLLAALALLLVIEGLLPAIHPGGLRRVLLQAAETDDQTLRIAGVVSMGLGALLLYGVRG